MQKILLSIIFILLCSVFLACSGTGGRPTKDPNIFIDNEQNLYGTQINPTAIPTITPIASPTIISAMITPTSLQEDIPTTVPQATRFLLPEQINTSLLWPGTGGNPSGVMCVGNAPHILIRGPVPAQNASNIETIMYGQQLPVTGCNFQPGEIVQITFILADETMEHIRVVTNDYGTWMVNWYGIPGEPIGNYKIFTYSISGSFQENFAVTKSNIPNILSFCSNEMPQSVVYLVGFQPFEEIVFARYSPQDTFKDYQIIYADDLGNAQVFIPTESANILAIGEDKRMTIDTVDGPINISIIESFSCNHTK